MSTFLQNNPTSNESLLTHMNVSVYIRYRKRHISISEYPGGTEEFEKFAGVAGKDFLKNGKRHQDWIYPVGELK